MIDSAVRVVVIGEVGALERLRPHLPIHGFALMPVEELVTPFDRSTQAGEEKLRGLERLYASLRGRILVRLMSINLNPEVLQRHGNPLISLHEQWQVIGRRLDEFLREKRRERMQFVSLLITEEGEWTEEFRPFLEMLSGSPDSHSGPSMCCYLMTRLLELGQNQVLHAREIWPEFVAGLLRHIFWCGNTSNKQASDFLNQVGLYAWRTTRVIAQVPETSLRAKLRDLVRLINGRLFAVGVDGQTATPLFAKPVQRGQLETSIFEAPVTNPIEGAAWNQSEQWLALLEDPVRWRQATLEHALQAAGEQWKLRSDVTLDALRQVGQRLQDREVIDSPCRLFPGELPVPALEGLSMGTEILDQIRQKIGQVEAIGADLREWTQDHLKAAKGFVLASERLVVGLAVAMAIVYGIISVQLVIQRFLPAGVFPFLHGVLLAGCAVAGVAAMLLAGYLTQRWRGRHAKRMLARRADDWIEANRQLRQMIADSLAAARDEGAAVREAVARRLLVARLKRIEWVLLSELQLSLHEGSVHLKDQVASTHPLDLAVRCGTVETDMNSLIKETLSGFRQRWEQLLGEAGDRVMISADAALTACKFLVGDLERRLRRHLAEAAVQGLRAAGQWESARTQIEVAMSEDQQGRLFSVDLVGGVPDMTLWYREGFEQIFGSETGGRHRRKVNASEMDPGSFGFWFAQSQLSYSQVDDYGRLRFESYHGGGLNEIQKSGSAKPEVTDG